MTDDAIREMTPTDLIALAEQIEAVTKFGSLEAVALNNTLHDIAPEPKVIQPPNYLRDMSAAAVFVPDGFSWVAGAGPRFRREGGAIAHIFKGAQLGDMILCQADGREPAQALTAAALRARAASLGAENG